MDFEMNSSRGGLRGTALAAVWAGINMLVPQMAIAQEPDINALGSVAELVRWSGVLTSLVVIAVAWVVLRFVRETVERLSATFATWRMALLKLATMIQFFVYVVTGTTIIMLSFRLDDRVLALVGGTIAVSVGFAIKDVVASFVAGIMIMIDRPFQVGDRVSFGGFYGDITAIGLRSVRLQTLDDNTVTIPNNKFISDITSCGNYGALDMQVVMDFYIGIDQNVLHAREIVSEAALTSRYIYLPKPVVVLVNEVIEGNYFAIRLRLKAYVLDTRYEKAFETDVHLRVLEHFRRNNVLPPAMLHRGAPSETAGSKPAAMV